MPAYARREIVPADEVGVYHCTARCVRRAFLCGVDCYSGKNYEHRRDWIRERIEQLAAIFAIDVCGYAVMSNHLHLILRTRPDLVPEWSDKEVASRWKRLFPSWDPATGLRTEPTEGDLNVIVSDTARVELLREQLSSLSWFMRGLCEPIARRANKEDECSGRFWEGRFGSQRLVDEGAILAGSIYVDLNPIRAGMAETPEDSEYTSAFDRIRASSNHGTIDRENSPSRPLDSSSIESSRVSEPNSQRFSDAWLCELTIDERPGPPAGDSSPEESSEVDVSLAGSTLSPEIAPPRRHRPRASNQGFLPIPLEHYLSLLDWTGRQFRGAKQQAIPATLAPILERLGLNGDRWPETMRQFGRWFKTAVGRRDSLKELAARRRKAWLHGQAGAALAFR
jgi:REP element-mobilizing transposase RayT